MKRAWFKRKIQTCYLHGGLLALATNLLLAATSLAQLADTRIAFMSTRSERNGEIFVMNADGKRVRRLTEHPQYDAVPAWSPDGQKITFVSFRDLKQIPERGVIRGEIYVMNADGTNPINLTRSVEKAERVSTWSPDGKQIALTSDRDGNTEVYVMNADGANPINLTNHPAGDSSPAWSPDGRQIAFSSNRDGNWEVYVMDADGINPINLTNHPAWDSSPSWGSIQPLSVTSKGRLATLWGKVKRSNTYGGK